MLPKIYTLPHTKSQPVFNYGQGQETSSQYRTKMGRHVVRPFAGMPVGRVAISNDALHKMFQVYLYRWVGSFRYQQRYTGVLQKNVA